MKLPYAEDINYWKTSRSTPDTWLDKAEAIIARLGGEVRLRASGRMEEHRAYLVDFTIDGDAFRIVYPVLPTRGEDIKAAERQAATLLFYEVKSKALKAAVFGARAAFFEFLLLDNGRTVGQLSLPELMDYVPKQLRAPDHEE